MLKFQGNSEEAADLVAYLASEQASFVSGANTDINGGLAFSQNTNKALVVI